MRKATITVLILISLLTMLGSSIIPNSLTEAGTATVTGPTSTIVSMRDPGNNVTDLLPANRNFTDKYYNSGLGRDMPLNWSYIDNPPSQSSSRTYSWTSSGYSFGSGYVYFYSYYSGTNTWTFDWWQNFLYNGTMKEESPTSAILSFRYYVSSIRYASSSNYLRVYLRFPNATDYLVWNSSITTYNPSWVLVSRDVTNQITQAGNGTYRLTLRYDGNFNQYGGRIYLYWDDAGLAITHPPRVKPYDLGLSINSGAVYGNSTSVKLSPAGSGLSEVGFSNDKLGTYIWNAFEPGKTYDWSLTAGADGQRTVWYEARNTVDTSGPVNSSIILDQHSPTRPNLASPLNETAVKTQLPSFTWDPCSDIGPSGLGNYTLLFDTTPSFNSGELRIRSTNNTFWNAAQALNQGQWYWRVISNDKAGNVNTSRYCMVFIDTVPPASTGLTSPGNGTFSNDVTLTLTWSSPYDAPPTSGIASYTLQYDTDPTFSDCTTVSNIIGTSYSVPLSGPLANGTWYWRVFAYDTAGNMGEYSLLGAVNIITPNNAPVAPDVISPRGDYTESLSPILRWTPAQGTALSLLDYYIIEVDTSPGFNSPAYHRFQTSPVGVTDSGSVPVPTELTVGTWNWRIRAVDKAGNLGAWSQVNSFTIFSGTNPMLIVLAGGGSGGAVFILILGYYFVRRSRIPFVIKKIDQSIKLISKGEMPQSVPMRTRTQLVKSIFETKLAIMSKEKLEEAEGKKKVSKEAIISPEKLAPQGLPKGAEAPAKAEAEESDVDLVAKELEKLEAREEKKPSDETELIKREIEELEKGSKKKKKSESG